MSLVAKPPVVLPGHNPLSSWRRFFCWMVRPARRARPLFPQAANTGIFENYVGFAPLGTVMVALLGTIAPLVAGITQEAARKRGLLWAMVVSMSLAALVLWGLIPADGFLRDPASGTSSTRPSCTAS